jgi:hypothetical protein
MFLQGCPTLFKALCATPQIFAVTDSEYKADKVSFAAGLKSKESDIGGVVSPKSFVILVVLGAFEIFCSYISTKYFCIAQRTPT